MPRIVDCPPISHSNITTNTVPTSRSLLSLRSSGSLAATPWLHTQATLKGVNMHWVECMGRTTSPRNGNSRNGDSSSPHQPIIVLLHGSSESWLVWRSVLRELQGSGYRVVAPDWRGCNLSTATEDEEVVGKIGRKRRCGSNPEPLSLDILVEDLREWLQLLLSEDTDGTIACLVGHELGGWVAWQLAAQYPGLVDRLVLSQAPPLALLRRISLSWWPMGATSYMLSGMEQINACCCFWKPDPSKWAPWYHALDRMESSSHPNDPTHQTKELLQSAVLKQPGSAWKQWSLMARELRAKSPRVTKTDADYHAAEDEMHRDWDETSVSLPVTLLWGTEDPFFSSSEWMSELHTVITGPTNVIQLDNCGHCAPLERPVEVARHILECLGHQAQQQLSTLVLA